MWHRPFLCGCWEYCLPSKYYPLYYLSMPTWHLMGSSKRPKTKGNRLRRLPFLSNTLLFLLSNSTGNQEHTNQWLAVLLNFNTVSIIDNILL